MTVSPFSVYYRLFAADIGAIPSKHALKADDRSLSRINIDWVPPPGTAGDYRRYICHREQIHPSRVVMFMFKPQLASGRGGWQLVSDAELIGDPNLDVGEGAGQGATPEMPLKLVVELGSGGLEGTASPIPVFVQGARSTGSVLGKLGRWMGSLLCH